MALGWASLNLKTLSITESSVAVVSDPQNAVQSFTVMPAAITSLPRLTVPATRGTCRSVESSSKSSTDVWGWTCTSVFKIRIYSGIKGKKKKKRWHTKIKDLQQKMPQKHQPKKTCSYHAASVGEGTVTAHKDITGNRLPKNFHAKYICNHLLSFLSKTTNKYMNKCRSNLKFTWIQKVYVIF